MQKGFGALQVILFLGLIIVLVLSIIQLKTKFINPESKPATQTQLMDRVYKSDDSKKSTVNHTHAQIKQFYVENKRYPKELSELKGLFNLDSGELERLTKDPFSYELKNDGYSFFVKLGNGEKYAGEQQEINKFLDASVWVDVDAITTLVTLFYAKYQRLPQNLEEIASDPEYSFFKIKKDPYTSKPYMYLPKDGGRGFVVSGKVGSGEDYKKDIDFD